MAGARTGHVEGGRVYGVKPLPKLRHGLRWPENVQVQMKHGPTTANRFLEREEGAARERADRDDEGGIRVARRAAVSSAAFSPSIDLHTAMITTKIKKPAKIFAEVEVRRFPQ